MAFIRPCKRLCPSAPHAGYLSDLPWHTLASPFPVSPRAVSAISSILQLDHLKLLLMMYMTFTSGKTSQEEWALAVHWVCTLTEQCHSCFLFWIYFAFSLLFLSMGWCWLQSMPAPGCTRCIHNPWTDKLDNFRESNPLRGLEKQHSRACCFPLLSKQNRHFFPPFSW